MARRLDRRELILGLGAAGLAASLLRAARGLAQETPPPGEGAAPGTEPSAAEADGPEAGAPQEAEAEAGEESEGEPQPQPATSYLVVQTADRITLKGRQLELRDVSPSTVYFSRGGSGAEGQVPTVDFVNQWSSVREQLPDGALNGTLSLLEDEARVAVKLHSPMFKSGNLVYRVEVLDGPTALSGGAGSLYLDVVGSVLAPDRIEGSRGRRGP